MLITILFVVIGCIVVLNYSGNNIDNYDKVKREKQRIYERLEFYDRLDEYNKKEVKHEQSL